MWKYVVLVVLLVAANSAFWYVGGPTFLQSLKVHSPAPATTNPVMLDVFIFTLQDEVNKKVGVPIEGYTPSMFLQVFPGLVETDFDGAQASIGHYAIAQGRLTHVLDDTQLIHSAAGALSRPGMETLLHNVSTRLGITLNDNGTITDVMRALVRE